MSKVKKVNPENRMPVFEVYGTRRKFLAYSGVTIAASGLLLGCKKDDDPVVPPVIDLVAPSGLAANNATAGQIILTWADNSDDEDGFSIERSITADSGFAEIADVAEDVEIYTDEDIDAGVEYYYRVRAHRGTDNSGYTTVVSSTGATVAVNLGSGDVGILNYAYALEQLEAAFYTQVIAGGYYATAPENEKTILLDLQKHEVIHREFFKAALTGAAPDDIIPGLEVDFSSVDFDDRASVLGTAKVFEDLGVSAYNGVGQFLQTTDYLVLAGKIVSVEARHAAAIRSILDVDDATSFAGDDIINDSGLEVTRTPEQVLTMASAFVITPIDFSNLPSGGTGGFQVPLPA